MSPDKDNTEQKKAENEACKSVAARQPTVGPKRQGLAPRYAIPLILRKINRLVWGSPIRCGLATEKQES